MNTLFKKAIRDLLLMKSQSLTISLLIGVGVALLVSSWSAYDGLSIAQSNFYAQSRFADIFATCKKAPLSLLSTIEKIPRVEIASARVEQMALLNIEGMDEPGLGQFISVPNEKDQLLNFVYVKSGHFPSENGEVLVNEAFAEAQKLKIGDEISAIFNSKIERFKIVGIGTSPDYIYALNISSPLPDNRHFGIFWVPERELRSLANMDGSFNSLSLKISRDADANFIKAEIDHLLKNRGGQSSYTRDRQLSNMFVTDELAQQKISAMVMPSIFLGVSAFLIHVIFTRLIQLQRRQIATLKAVGYSNIAVGLHFTLVVLLISIVGTAIGVIGGVFIGQWNTAMYARFFNFPELKFILSWQSLIISVCTGLGASLIGASSSVISVVRLTPTEAMQPPTPPQFKSFIIDRWAWFRRLRSTSRMMVRNLFQKPLRLFFSEIGLGLGIAIMIMALFWKDSVFFIVESSFYQADKGHIQVGFTEPRNYSAIEELRHIDGVLEVEAYRSIAVRISHQQRKKEISLSGLRKNTGMKNLIDINFKLVNLPESGLLLSKALAEKWDLKIGDKLHIETITGRFFEWEIPISGFADDLIGSAAYIRIEELWKMLDEGESYTQANLYIDQTKGHTLFVELKNHPQILAVNVKSILLESFRTNMMEMIMVFTYILISFAMLIAIGVIYNNSRVNLSERAWELTSLRILGFDKSYVFKLFFGELSLQLLVAIPLGLFFGYVLSFLSTKLIHTDVFVFPFVIEKSTYSLSILVMLFGFLISGLVINRHVSKLSLADALKERE